LAPGWVSDSLKKTRLFRLFPPPDSGRARGVPLLMETSKGSGIPTRQNCSPFDGNIKRIRNPDNSWSWGGHSILVTMVMISRMTACADG
jgi:hypothetical protein